MKIYDQEGPEEPHIHIRFKTRRWRISLRSKQFLDGGSWGAIPDELRRLIEHQWPKLQDAWNSKFPANPISST